MKKYPSKAVLIGLALALCLGTMPARAQSPVTAPAAAPAVARPAEKSKVTGVPNFGKVNEFLYRGGQPKPEGYAELRKRGIEIVVNLRDEPDRVDGERRQVEKLGMQYISMPWAGFAQARDADVERFFSVLRDNPNKKIFVHCRRGAERTGVMIATYRMAAQSWTAEQALNEMEAFRFRGFWFGHLKKYVREFPARAKSNPQLSLPPAP